MNGLSLPSRAAAWRIARVAAAASLALALSACAALFDTRETLAIWRIDAVPAAPAGDPVAWQLAVDEPTAAEPLDGARIVLAPGGGEFGVYRGARWGERAPRLLQDLLLRSLADSGRIAGLGRGTDGVRADYRLLVDLRAFHVEADAGQARIALSARLLRWPDGSVVAAQAFEAEAPVARGGIPAVVAAFESASAELVPALAAWTLAQGEADHAQRAAARGAP
ncbi:MAG: ABC-type transport auxiliary lipoprotein family protein [Xanthomonadaceae bacterium]|jgi:cholesterol transport system auxiliary component|nr:ABC-type transport auxiliary lipoprotein family protein [Xanthomonadaceae bacterium]